MSKIKSSLRFVIIPAIVCAVAVFGQSPKVDIDYHQHPNLWSAQKNIVVAYEKIGQAQKENPGGLRDLHAQKACDFLLQASKELKLAASKTGEIQH